jgi:mono/diheme cytochrome c family protein
VLGSAAAAAATDAAGSGNPARAPAANQKAAVTFTKDVAPILFENCATCHRPGEVAPFPLLSYKDAKRRAGQIADVTGSRFMPPWLPVPGHGEFADERRLTDAQTAALRAWADAGAPEGDPKDLPPAPKFTEGGRSASRTWSSNAREVHPAGRGPGRVPGVRPPLNLTEDKYVTAVDFRPANRKIVHHALLFTDRSGQARKLDAQDPEPGYGRGGGGVGFAPSGGLGGWAPGVTARHLPDGVARLMHKGSDLVVQVHFHPSGKEEQEQSTIGIYFAKKEPQKLAFSLPKGFRRSMLDIAPGRKDFAMTDSFTLPMEANVVGIFPHAHLLCKEIKVDATLPDGSKQPLVWIKDWDWNWQDEFQYKSAVRLPAGTRIDQKYVFDNSAENPRNPNQPPKRVTWGEQTADEMAITFFLVTAPKDALIFQLGAGGGSGRGTGAARDAIREALRQRGGPTATQPAARPAQN